MLSQITHHIFAHSLINPPSLNSGCDVDLMLKKLQGQIHLVKEETNFQTKYLLTVYDSSTLGLTSYEQEAIETFFDNLIHSMNFNLKRAALTVLRGEIPKSDVKLQPKSQVRVEETPKGKHIEITETLVIQEFIYITIKFTEEIDENSILSLFRLINKLYSGQVADNLKANNLKKALTEYNAAMKVFDRLMIFKHLFNSLEIAANWDGVERHGEALDKEISTITGSQQKEVEKWRRLYNRTKHIDREPNQVNEFISGIMNLHYFLEPLRIATNKILIDRLKRTISV